MRRCAVSVTRSMEVYGAWVATLAGKNGAHVARLLSVGATWSFGGRFGGIGASSTNAQRDRTLPFERTDDSGR